MKIYPNIYIDKNSFEKWLKTNRGNTDLLKNINQKMKNPIKLKFSSNNTFLIYSNTDGKNIYLKYISEEAVSEKSAEYTLGFVGLKLAQMYHLQENYEEAEKNYLIAAKKGNIEAMTNLSAIYVMQKKYDEAEKLLLKAIEGNDSFAYNNLGSLYLMQNKYDKAKIYFLKATERGYTPAIINLGFLSIKLKDYPNAKKYFKMAADLGNEDAQEIYREMLKNGY